MTNIKNKFILNSILIFSVLALGLAYFIQYVLNHLPCNLCLIERIPYLVTVILLSFFLIFNKFRRIILIIIAASFIFGTIISGYHIGIEQGIFNESFVCNLKNDLNILSSDQLLKELTKKTVSCKDITFRFFGFSLATFNAIISLILSVIIINIIRDYEKNK